MPAGLGADERRAAVERELVRGDVVGLRELAGRLESEGITVTPEVLRADVRALGAVRVQKGATSVLALPVDAGGRAGSGSEGRVPPRLAAEISADPDWSVQVGVVAVVVVFMLVALLGWLISV